MAASKRNLPMPAGSTGAIRASRRTRLNADTSAEPEGLTRRVVLNFLEAFFRRPWLHLLPLILMLVLGGANAFSSKEEFKSTGTITAESSTVLGDLIPSNSQGFNAETPATIVARNINELLRTTNFLNTVAGKLQADATDSQKALLRDVIAKDVGCPCRRRPAGAGLGHERASRPVVPAGRRRHPQLHRDRQGQQHRPERPGRGVLPGPGRRGRCRPQGRARRPSMRTSSKRASPTRCRSRPAQQQQINTLQADVDRAESQYDAKLDSLDQAKLASNSAATEVDQRLRQTDPPEEPLAPEPRLKKAALTLVIFGVLGVLLSLASVIVAATLDRTIRVPGDITAKFDLDVLAVVPDARAR